MQLDPRTTAIICVECQEGVLGAGSVLPWLAEAAGPAVSTIARLAEGARAAGILVVHATYEGPHGGTRHGTAPLWRTLGPQTDGWQIGGPESQVLPQLLRADDLIMARHHGLNPAAGTELLPVLRGRGVETVVLAGVSLNVALILTAGEAVHEGFRVVVPRDAVVATPPEYAEQVLNLSMRMLAEITDVDSVLAALA